MDARLGYAKRDTVGRDGENSGIGPRSCSPMWVWWRSTCRGDRDASFNWAIVAKRQRRLGEIDDLVISLVTRSAGTCWAWRGT